MPNETILLNFHRNFHKLAQPQFTTIRGKSHYRKCTVGQTVSVEAPKLAFQAVIIKVELAVLSALPLDFLKADAEFPGCTITSHEQFIKLLNSFRAPYWAQVAPDSELTIITLQKSNQGCRLDTDGDGNCPVHPNGCPK